MNTIPMTTSTMSINDFQKLTNLQSYTVHEVYAVLTKYCQLVKTNNGLLDWGLSRVLYHESMLELLNKSISNLKYANTYAHFINYIWDLFKQPTSNIIYPHYLILGLSIFCSGYESINQSFCTNLLNKANVIKQDDSIESFYNNSIDLVIEMVDSF